MLFFNKIIIIAAFAYSLFLNSSETERTENSEILNLKHTTIVEANDDNHHIDFNNDDDPLEIRSRSESPVLITSTHSVFAVCKDIKQKHKPGTLLLDIDGTVLNEIQNDVNFGNLLEINLPELLSQMRSSGWKVIFFTARKFEDAAYTNYQLNSHNLLAGSPYNGDEDVQFRVFAKGTYFTNHGDKGDHIHHVLRLIKHEDEQKVFFVDNNMNMLHSVSKMRPETSLHHMIGSSPQ